MFAEYVCGLVEEGLQETAHGLLIIYMVDSYDFPFEEAVIFLQFSGFFVGKVDFEVPVHIEYLVPQVGGIGKDALCEFCRAAADIPSEIGAHHHVFHHFIGRAESDVVLFDGVRRTVHLDLEASFGTKEQDAPARSFVEPDKVSDVFEYDKVFR